MNLYRMLADLVVVVHFGYVVFVVFGMGAIVLGILLRWSWVRNFWFRAAHFAMIAVVALESLCGILCPLTEWEDRLRELADEPSEPNSFIGRWVHEWLFVDLSSTTLAVCYCLFGLAVLFALILAPPRWPWRNKQNGTPKAR